MDVTGNLKKPLAGGYVDQWQAPVSDDRVLYGIFDQSSKVGIEVHSESASLNQTRLKKKLQRLWEFVDSSSPEPDFMPDDIFNPDTDTPSHVFL